MSIRKKLKKKSHPHPPWLWHVPVHPAEQCPKEYFSTKRNSFMENKLAVEWEFQMPIL